MTTQYANASYQEVIDLHTESDRVSVVGIHTPCSDTPYNMLKGFWDQFKKVRYNGCSMTLVPAAQLPVDPLGVSYDAGEPTIDPRDVLNPIMFHGCHGDDLGSILNGFYNGLGSSSTGQFVDQELSDSTDHNKVVTGSGYQPIETIFEQLYYRCLTDNTWLKSHPQRGFRKNGLHPMVYSLATNHQLGIVPGSSLIGKGIVHDDDTGVASSGGGPTIGMSSNSSSYVNCLGAYGTPYLNNDGGAGFDVNVPVLRQGLQLFTPRLQRLGWLDTKNVFGLTVNDAISVPVTEAGRTDAALATAYQTAEDNLNPTMIPKLFMGMLLLPPAYKVTQHFRLVLNHSFSFAKFRGASMQNDRLGMIKNAYSYYDFSGYEDSKKSVDPVPEDDDDDKKQ